MFWEVPVQIIDMHRLNMTHLTLRNLRRFPWNNFLPECFLSNSLIREIFFRTKNSIERFSCQAAKLMLLAASNG